MKLKILTSLTETDLLSRDFWLFPTDLNVVFPLFEELTRHKITEYELNYLITFKLILITYSFRLNQLINQQQNY